jgi:hypothetical protein
MDVLSFILGAAVALTGVLIGYVISAKLPCMQTRGGGGSGEEPGKK